jgi:hypothetical protein
MDQVPLAALLAYVLLVAAASVWYCTRSNKALPECPECIPVAISEEDLRKLGIDVPPARSNSLLAPLLLEPEDEVRDSHSSSGKRQKAHTLLELPDDLPMVQSPISANPDSSRASVASTCLTSKSQSQGPASSSWHQEIVEKYTGFSQLSPAHHEILSMFKRSVEYRRSRTGGNMPSNGQGSAPTSPTAGGLDSRSNTSSPDR